MLKTNCFPTILLFGFLLVSCGPQESPVMVDFKAKHATEKDFHFDASTLRMVNLQHDEAFNKMVRNIRKLDFYQVAQKNFDAHDLQQFQSALGKSAFENWMTVKTDGLHLTVWGRDKSRAPQIVALMVTDSSYYFVDMVGMFNVSKVPELWSSFQSEKFLNPFDLKKGQKTRKQR